MKYKLKCVSCGRIYDETIAIYTCDCNGKLEIELNLDNIQVELAELRQRQPTKYLLPQKYFEFMPLLGDPANVISLGEGYTPLLKAKRLADKLNLKNLYIKNETTNPTGSFKDRPIIIGLNKALELGATVVATASSGNAANSLAAGAAKANIKCVAFVSDTAPTTKISQLLFYGAKVVRVKRPEGFVGDPTVVLLRKSYQKFGWHPVPSFGTLNPYQMEGAKTIAYEIAEQLPPDAVIIPVGGGGLLRGNYQAFTEYIKLGFIDKMPRLYGVQAEGCAPLVKAYNSNKPIETWEHPQTIATGLADPYTWDGDACITALKATDGTAIAVSDQDILEAAKLIANLEGIFAEPSGVASLAGLIKLIQTGEITRNDIVCCEITGSGFKDLKSLIHESDVYCSKIVTPDINIDELVI
jgi:threonine synthase